MTTDKAVTATSAPEPLVGCSGFSIRTYRDDIDRDAVIALWQACELVRPWNDPGKDIDRKLTVQPEWFLVVVADDQHGGAAPGSPIASVMMGFEGHRGWVNYLAVAPAFQRRRIGESMMAEVERRLTAFGGPKMNLQIRASNNAVIAFYQRIGYRVEEVVSMGKRLIPDD